MVDKLENGRYRQWKDKLLFQEFDGGMKIIIRSYKLFYSLMKLQVSKVLKIKEESR